jgi:hypothetical protein
MNHKKKLIFAGCLYGVYHFYLRPKINTIREVYSQLKDYSSNDPNASFVKLQVTYTSLLPKLLDDIKIRIENKYKAEELRKRVSDKSASNEERKYLYSILKDHCFASIITTFITLRIVFFLSKVSIIILDKIRREGSIPDDLYYEILEYTWSLLSRLMDSIISQSELSILTISKQMPYNSKMDYHSFVGEIEKMKNSCCDYQIDPDNREVNVALIKGFLSEIRDKIEELNKCEYDTMIEETLKIEVKLLYLQNLHDVVSSSLNSVMIYKSIENDFAILKELIKVNFDSEEIKNKEYELSIPKIVGFCLNIFFLTLDKDKTIFNVKNTNESEFVKELFDYLQLLTN